MFWKIKEETLCINSIKPPASSQVEGALMPFGSLLFQEKAITPSESFLFPGTDWLIGNHSDELTPWIPVIAARQVINRHNLTQRLECQLMYPLQLGITLWACEGRPVKIWMFCSCVVCMYFYSDHPVVLLCLSLNSTCVVELSECHQKE